MNAQNAIYMTSRWSALLLCVLLNLFTPNNETLMQYVVKTIIGGAVWLAFQMFANYLTKRINKKNENKKENKK